MRGTRITYKGLPYNSDGDKRPELKKKVISDAAFKRLLSDKSYKFLQMTDHELLPVNNLKYKGKRFLLLEPNPVTFYYSLAYDAAYQMDIAKKHFEVYLSDNNIEDRRQLHINFSFIFKVGSVGVLFSFLALEAFLNQLMPDFGEIKFRGKLYSKADAQRKLSFEDKMKIIIPALRGKNFHLVHPNKAVVLDRLKKLRDELTHLKERRKDGFAAYQDVYQDILKLDLKKTAFAVKTFINFYHPKLIQNYRKTPTK